MRIARFAHPQGMAFGVVEGEPGAPADSAIVAEIKGLPFAGAIEPTGQSWAVSDVRLLAPLLPSKIVCVGKNYAAHAAELGGEVPASPVIFLKPSSAVIGPNTPIRLPADSERVDHEGELALVIGQLTRDVSVEDAGAAIFGYTCANDVTARDQQKIDGQWTRAKSHDSFCPLGPWIETAVEPDDLGITTTVDGKSTQDSRTSMMVHDVPSLVSFVSSVMTLWPGDVILTGTPEGVGPITDGQHVTVTIEKVGSLTNPVANR